MQRGLLLTMAAATLAGIGGVVAADVFSSVDPVVVAQYRSVIAAGVLVPVAYWRRMSLTGGRLGQLALFGAVIAALTITFYWSIDRLGVGPGVTLQFTASVPVLAWLRFVQHRPVPAKTWVAAAFAVGGTAVMLRAWDLDSLDLVGLLAGVGSMLLYATYLLFGEHLGRRLSDLTIIAYGFAVSALIWVVVVPPSIIDASATVWFQLAWVGLMATAAPFLLMVMALSRTDSGSVGVVATFEPVVAATAAWIFLGQDLSWVQVGGGALVMWSLVVVQRTVTEPVTTPI
ncbi:MAG: EamA family transporter [Acidimicrobiia bacterium]|nr:EamA family transporter [Acidimicrobiia bacterium]